jgi:hypothetical protein
MLKGCCLLQSELTTILEFTFHRTRILLDSKPLLSLASILVLMDSRPVTLMTAILMPLDHQILACLKEGVLSLCLMN